MSDTESTTAPAADPAVTTGTPAPGATDLDQLRAEVRDLREQIARLKSPPAAASPSGVMAPRVPGETDEPRRRAAAAFSRTGDRAALLAYMRARRQGAD